MSKKRSNNVQTLLLFHVVQMLGLARIRGMSVWLNGRHL